MRCVSLQSGPTRVCLISKILVTSIRREMNFLISYREYEQSDSVLTILVFNEAVNKKRKQSGRRVNTAGQHVPDTFA